MIFKYYTNRHKMVLMNTCFINVDNGKKITLGLFYTTRIKKDKHFDIFFANDLDYRIIKCYNSTYKSRIDNKVNHKVV